MNELPIFFQSLKNKSALITGASAGIGYETAKILALQGMPLTLIARREERLRALATELKTATKIFVGDVRDAKFLQRLCSEGAFEVDVVVNNAGLARGFDEIAEAKIEDWDEMIATNLSAAVKITKYALPWMIKQQAGHIINITSIASHVTYARGSVYAATKHALLAFAKTLRSEVCQHNIKVTNISPGMVETEFSEVRFNGDKSRAKTVYAGMKPLCAYDIAWQILYSLLQPPHINIDEILLTPVAQGEVTKVIRHL